MSEILLKKEIRTTAFRKELIAIFEKFSHAISMRQIEEELGKHDRITLYRTMKLFTENGVIHEIAIPQEESKYAMCEEGCKDGVHHHQHVHFKCEVCERVYCLEVDKTPELSLPNFIIKNMEINVNGVCDECN